MGKFTERGLVPADDPMFNGQWMVFAVRRKPLAESQESEKAEQEQEDTPTQSQPQE
jgi:hypothetical protein